VNVAAHLIAVGVTGLAPLRDTDDRAPQWEPVAACVECGTAIDGWGCWYSNGLGELVPYCPDCARREFGEDGASPAPSTTEAA
jgi:hypothetical protein